LNSSPAQLAGIFIPFSQYGQGYLLPDLIYHQNLDFWAIILDPEMLKSLLGLYSLEL